MTVVQTSSSYLFIFKTTTTTKTTTKRSALSFVSKNEINIIYCFLVSLCRFRSGFCADADTAGNLPSRPYCAPTIGSALGTSHQFHSTTKTKTTVISYSLSCRRQWTAVCPLQMDESCFVVARAVAMALLSCRTDQSCDCSSRRSASNVFTVVDNTTIAHKVCYIRRHGLRRRRRRAAVGAACRVFETTRRSGCCGGTVVEWSVDAHGVLVF